MIKLDVQVGFVIKEFYENKQLAIEDEMEWNWMLIKSIHYL